MTASAPPAATPDRPTPDSTPAVTEPEVPGRRDDAIAPGAASYPRLAARTARFTLGVPRVVGLAHQGRTVVFLRTRSGTDRTGMLWALDLITGTERLLVDPDVLLAGAGEEISEAERSRRERSRESGVGIVAAAVDPRRGSVVFTLSSRLFVGELAEPGVGTAGAGAGSVRELPARRPVIDPRPDPSGCWVAYASAGQLRLTAVDGSGDRALCLPESDAVSYGVAEFVAAEEIGRYRGYWWAPDGSALLVARVDESQVARRTVSDPSDPRRAARQERYPFAGSTNADVSLWWVPLGGRPEPGDPAGAGSGAAAVQVEWDALAFPYLVAVSWSAAGPPLLAVQSRDQRELLVLAVEAAEVRTGTGTGTGAAVGPRLATTAVGRDSDPSWVHLVPGVPAWGPDGRLLTVRADTASDTYRLTVDATPLSPPGSQVAAVLDVGSDDVLLVLQDDPVSSHLATISMAGTLVWHTGPRSAPGTPPSTAAAGVHTATRADGTLVITHSGLERAASTVLVRRAGRPEVEIESRVLAAPPLREPELLELGPHRLRAWLLQPDAQPRAGTAAPGSVPVLLDPYGGPGGARVVASARRLLESQWWADQGFAVLVVDGRGTPGRGPASDRAIEHDFAGAPLEDQIEALTAAAVLHPEFDLTRVAIRGWSFGGYLSALAVLRRPDIFAAAVAGAPPTDWTLYDTHYTERYLGHPALEPEVYRRNGLLERPEGPPRPLMIIHGLADDNVLVAHSLALSGALLHAGYPHTFLPLSGITHMATDETVAENLLLLQLDFLRNALR